MNGVRRAVVVTAISVVCLGACGDDNPSPVDAGNTGTTEVMTDETEMMSDKTEVMTDETDVMTDKSTSTTAG